MSRLTVLWWVRVSREEQISGVPLKNGFLLMSRNAMIRKFH